MNEIKPIIGTWENISALADGDLQGDACEQALTALLTDPQAIQTWHTYQVVGDVLRSSELVPSRSDLIFLAKLELRLAQEPQRPQRQQIEPLVEDVVIGPVRGIDGVRPAANASVFRWIMLATAACMALVGIVGLELWTQTGQRADAQMAAVHSEPQDLPVVTADSTAGTMLRDPRLDELMAAHRQLGGHSALQVPAGFLRNATYDGTAR